MDLEFADEAPEDGTDRNHQGLIVFEHRPQDRLVFFVGELTHLVDDGALGRSHALRSVSTIVSGTDIGSERPHDRREGGQRYPHDHCSAIHRPHESITGERPFVIHGGVGQVEDQLVGGQGEGPVVGCVA